MISNPAPDPKKSHNSAGSDSKNWIRSNTASPVALTIGYEVRQKIWNCQVLKKKKIFFTAKNKEENNVENIGNHVQRNKSQCNAEHTFALVRFGSPT